MQGGKSPSAGLHASRSAGDRELPTCRGAQSVAEGLWACRHASEGAPRKRRDVIEGGREAGAKSPSTANTRLVMSSETKKESPNLGAGLSLAVWLDQSKVADLKPRRFRRGMSGPTRSTL
jgi:hypothetical protein